MPTPARPIRFLALCAAAMLVGPADAGAASECVVVWRSSAPEASAWASAVHDVERTVEQLAPSASDCREIVVVPDIGGAAVKFRTRDGRLAERHIRHPHELRALVEALLVALPVEVPVAHLAPAPNEERDAPLEQGAPGARVVRAAGEAREARAAGSERRDGRFVLGATGGFKLGWPSDAAAPILHLTAGVTLGRWELGVFGRWEPLYERLGNASVPGYAMTALGGGASVGRRVPIGDVDLLFGGTLGIYSVEENVENVIPLGVLVDHKRHLGDSIGEPRLGAYLGVVVPRTARLRLRSQLTAEAALSQHTPADDRLPPFPRWSLGLSLGAEADLP